jgi:cytochrome c5
MAEPSDRRSNRARKPIVPFDEKIALAKPAKAPKSTKPTTKSTKSTKSAESTQKSKTPAAQSTQIPKADDAIEELCNITQDLDISNNPKAKKKAKAAEITRLNALSLQGIMDEAKPLKELKFEAFDPGEPREPKINIPDNIDLTSPLELLDLFIPPELYSTIADNTNLYAIAHDAHIAPTSNNRRYWWPTNPSEIRVLFGIYFYMGVHREPNYNIYWETPRPNGPNHTLSKYMSLNRFENLRHYLHISKPTLESMQAPIPTNDDENIDEFW